MALLEEAALVELVEGQVCELAPPNGHVAVAHDLLEQVLDAHARLPQAQAPLTAVLYVERPLAMFVPAALAPFDEVVLAEYVPVYPFAEPELPHAGMTKLPLPVQVTPEGQHPRRQFGVFG